MITMRDLGLMVDYLEAHHMEQSAADLRELARIVPNLLAALKAARRSLAAALYDLHTGPPPEPPFNPDEDATIRQIDAVLARVEGRKP